MKLLEKLLVILCFVSISCSNNEKILQPVTTELIIDNTEFEINKSIKLGVLFEIEPGWHIYWQNPGDSGLPTVINFELPQSFKHGNFYWPYPVSFKGELGTDYGYEKEVLIWTEVQLPEDYNKNSHINITAQVDWLNCKEICIPGKAEINKIFNLNTKLDNQDLFIKWAKKIPQKKISNIDYEILKTKNETDGLIVSKILVTSKNDIKNIELFPQVLDELKVERIEYEKLFDNKYLITVNSSVYKGQNLSSDVIKSVLVIENYEDVKKSLDILLKL